MRWDATASFDRWGGRFTALGQRELAPANDGVDDEGADTDAPADDAKPARPELAMNDATTATPIVR